MTDDKRIDFSLVHTTARLPDGWRLAAQAWFNNCDNPEAVEHVLTSDEEIRIDPVFPHTVYSVNDGAKTCVAGWNKAASLSTGRFLISIADDWFPCPHWDTELRKVIEALPDGFDGEHVLNVNTGGNPGLLTFCLLTRAYYNRFGYLLYPEYIGVFADNDFTDTATRLGVVRDATHLYFEHVHPLLGKGQPDKIHLWQGRKEAWEVGKRVYVERSKRAGQKVRPKLAICTPGEWFSAAWVHNWTQLIGQLLPRFDLVPIFGYTANVYIIRESMSRQAQACCPTPDYVLWMDDDNLLSFAQFSFLLADLEQSPAIDMVSGWCWVQPEVAQIASRTSVGNFGADGECVPLTHEELLAGADVQEIQYSGFPAVLMRYETLTRAGENPFAPILDPRQVWGFSGEDTAFSIRARERGRCRLFVDKRVQVPHLKLRIATPVAETIPEAESPAPVPEPAREAVTA